MKGPEPNRERRLDQLDETELWWVWQIVATEAVKLGFATTATIHAIRIVEATNDPTLTGSDVRQQVIDSIESVDAVVSEHRPLNPEEDPET